MYKFFCITWWKYLLKKPKDRKDWARYISCRLNNHKDGPIWYNPDGVEPDMRCKRCGEDLG